MPIKVKYGGDISGLAQLALSAGAANLPRTQVRSPIGRGGGGGRRGGGQSRVDDISAADMAVLEQDATEAMFSQEMEMMREEAKIKADQWEWQYDTAAKKRMAEWDKAIDYFSSSLDIEDADRQQYVEYAQNAKFGIQQSPIRKKPQWDDSVPENMRGGMPGELENGLYGYFVNKDGIPEFRQIDPAKTMAGMELQQRAADEKERRASILKVMAMEVTPTYPGRERALGTRGEGVKAFLGMDVPAQEGAPRKYSAGEAAQLVDRLMGLDQPEQDPRQSEAELQQITEAQKADDLVWEEALENNRELIGWAKAIGKRTEAEKKLPEWEGLARSFMREVRKRSAANRPIPKEMLPAIEQALAILATAKRERKQTKAK